MKHYSPSTKGFYDKEVHTVIPEDCVEITDEYWQELQGVEIDFDGEKPIKKVYSNEELAKQELDKQISEAKQYLASTDWYIIRYADSGKEVPSDIKIKREEARISIGGINE